jgi:hypothetical protein
MIRPNLLSSMKIRQPTIGDKVLYSDSDFEAPCLGIVCKVYPCSDGQDMPSVNLAVFNEDGDFLIGGQQEVPYGPGMMGSYWLLRESP